MQPDGGCYYKLTPIKFVFEQVEGGGLEEVTELFFEGDFFGGWAVEVIFGDA